MIIEHAEFRLRPGTAAQFVQAFADVRHLITSAAGCKGVRLLPSVDHADTYLLQVLWERLEDHTELFPRTDAAAQVGASLAPHCDEPPRVVHYDDATPFSRNDA